jgi:N-methylhydantoinase A/oxoprolinase/acetone carboxylase beta subunit
MRAAQVLTPLDEAAVEREVRALLEAGCEALVIHFLHAYANPAHERARARSRARSGRTPTSRSAMRCCRSSASTSAARRRA